MPRLPAGFHRQSSSGVPGAFAPQRYRVTPQQDYWRQTVSELHAGGVAQVLTFLPPGGGVITNPFAPAIPAVAAAGPQAVGEKWLVDLVQVQLGTQVGQPPQVIQQAVAQRTGTTTLVPPPIIAQVWLCHASMVTQNPLWQTGKLLAQTTQGGNDAMSVAAPLLTAGEVVAVVWYGWSPSPSPPSMSLRGTRYTLSAT